MLSGPPFPDFDDAPTTLTSLLRSRAEQNLQSPFVEIDQAGLRTAKTAAELHELALQLLDKLARAQADGCDIVLCFESALDFVPAAWAGVYGGYACLPWQLPKFPPEELLASRLQLFREKFHRPVLVTRHSVWNRLASLRPSPFRSVVLIDRDEEIHLQGQASSEPPQFPPRETSGSAFLLLTSGTTRKSKIAITGHNCLRNQFLGWEKRLLVGPRLYSKPFDSVAGLGIILTNASGNLFLQPERAAVRAGDYLSAIEEFRIRSIGISSSVAIRILAAAQQHADRDLSSLESIALGAEMIVPRVAVQLGAKLEEMGATKLGISFVYGMTETGTLCRKPNQTLDEVRESGQQVLASVGGCTAGYSIRIVDENGDVLPPGHVGGIEVWSGEKLFSGYLNDPEVNQESFAKDGWFKTGDVGLVERGELRLTGRQKSTIVINAKKFSLEAIEAQLRDTEGIHRSLVAAGPFRSAHSASDELAVFFVPNDGVSLDHICRQISRAVGRQGLSAKHLVPLKEFRLPRDRNRQGAPRPAGATISIGEMDSPSPLRSELRPRSGRWR